MILSDCVVILMNLVRPLIGLKLVLQPHGTVNIIRVFEASHRTCVAQGKDLHSTEMEYWWDCSGSGVYHTNPGSGHFL